MLSFFRKYQKIIFLFTTIVVISSFAFFGTYRAFAPNSATKNETVLYTTLKGRKITENYFEKMISFLEREPAFSYDVRKILASNPLNDGVLTRDFLLQELTDLLISEECKSVLEKKFLQEKHFTLYSHPIKKELSAQTTWQLYAPELWQQFSSLQKETNALSKEALLARSMLYVTHQRFNGEMLQQILRYQEYQMGGANDPLLVHKDLSLFGYHTLRDWFGDAFLTQAAKVIIHGAQLAKVEGLKVSKQEVYADLQERAHACFLNLQKRGELPVKSGAEMMPLLLSYLQMEEKDLVQIWEDVLYFRRLLDARSSTLVMDDLALKEFTHYAHRALTVKVKKMTEKLAFHTTEELKGFELYLEKVGEKRSDILSLPKSYLSSEKIAMKAPELLGRRYWVNMAQVKKGELSSKVALPQLWAWQEENYADLQERFALPEWASFDQVEDRVRIQVDEYSYARIIAAHPEWIHEVLATKKHEECELFLPFAQVKAPLKGIEDVSELRYALDQEDVISAYSQDGEHYYSFRVSKRGSMGEVLSYQEALTLGAIAELQKRERSSIAPLFSAIESDLRERGVAIPEEGKEQFLVERRFYSLLAREETEVGFDSFYHPESSYRTVNCSENLYEVAARLPKGSKSFACEEGQLFVYEVDEKLPSKDLSLEKLFLLQKFVSRDIRRHTIEEIMASL